MILAIRPNRRLYVLFLALISAVAVVACGDKYLASASPKLDKYNVVWNSPSKDSSGSMPLGNGDIGLNVWVEENGDLLFYISKTDAWNQNARLLKLGRVRVKLTPNPFASGIPFVQTLRLSKGEIEVQAGVEDEQVNLRIWVDANQPVVLVEAASQRRFNIQANLEMWRDKPRVLTGRELHSAYGLQGSPEPVIETSDRVLPPQDGSIVWYHRNLTSIWPSTLKLQGMEAWMDRASDPLLNLTFGGAMQSNCMKASNWTTLNSPKPVKRCVLSINLLTQQTTTEQEWVEQLKNTISSVEARSLKRAYRDHLRWWEEFWERSWIWTSGTPEAETVTRGYLLQRFISASGGRGAYPIKFNGSIFTFDYPEGEQDFNADYRLWGGPYWFQNTRLSYWPMLATGDFEMMLPLFNMYNNILPFAKERTRRYFGHQGAFFPETMYFWGAYTNTNYGWNRKEKPISYVQNPYIRWYYSGGLELSALMLDYYRYTGDRQFLEDTLLPLTDAILTFYDQHYSRDEQGLILFKPAQALETSHNVLNPLPEIAGLRFVLDGLLELEPTLIGDRRPMWQRLRTELPPIPVGEKDAQKVLLPAEKLLSPKASNIENPELYAVFPYRIFGISKPELEIARQTFAQRRIKRNTGWHQDEIQAALLGLTEEAQQGLALRFATKHQGIRFPAFWGPNYDWIPDQTHGGVGMIALQKMLLQADGKRILLFPAWPKDWDVEFRLHAPMNTTVEGVYEEGELKQLKVTPQSRRKDVLLMMK
ncbi:MAG: DUF5703 domain-containing protein [Xenococcaceae cyanobacterium MO_167.B27]|nr:DUF5703 domain-containing protein [Xenococcaceae cyanobacterium MO_167.B27]